ncbi:MAG: hypothetical protein CMG44_03700 [Candidatus Marinimicrobia bacterium]|nr:hypothetical protein [Candidatus Neomarinimicrobiota bacterium]|tara:strand:- start:441 stop:959 length:519 start_codon:yes stop_codon:yes gene_type:complete
MIKQISLLAILLIAFISDISAQFKGLDKQLKAKAAAELNKAVKSQVKPLTLDYKVTNYHYNPLRSPNKLSIDIEFTGYNPNKIGIALNRIEFDLSINKKHASKFYNDKKIKIPKEANFTFKEKADLKLTVMGKAIFDAIVKRKAKYQIDGTYYIDTKFGTFPLKAKLAEKEM